MRRQHKLIKHICHLFAVLALFAVHADELLGSRSKGVTDTGSEMIRELRIGMSHAEVELLLGSRGTHQFTVLISNTAVRCVAYFRRGVFGKHYFVFQNDLLIAVSDPPPFEMQRVPYQGTWLNKRVLDDPNARVSKVLAAENIIGPELVAALDPKPPPMHRTDPGLTAAYLITRKLMTDREREAEREAEYNRLLDRFDPFQIELGMKLRDVEGRLGVPKIIESVGKNLEMRYYGSIEYGLSGSRELMWLALVYDDEEEVIRIFSNDFIDFAKVRALEVEWASGASP